MRVFWFIIAVLIVVGVVVAFNQLGPRRERLVRQETFSSTMESAPPEVGPAAADEVRADAVESVAIGSPEDQGTPPLGDTSTTSATKEELNDRAVPGPADSATQAESAKPQAAAGDAATLVDDLITSASAREEQANQTDEKPVGPGTGEVVDAKGLLADSLSAFPADKTEPVTIKKLDDGALLLDDRFVIRGSGTVDDPYEITWDLLMSASETYIPRLGQLKLPQRVTMLHDKYVKITGHAAIPMGSAEVKELLAMLNQWDGCCIGMPPSPYDAIEVKLKQPIRVGRQHFSPFATVEGRLKVDPYLMDKWLVGLYVMDDATADLQM